MAMTINRLPASGIYLAGLTPFQFCFERDTPIGSKRNRSRLVWYPHECSS